MTDFISESGNENGRAEGIGAPAQARKENAEFDAGKIENAASAFQTIPSIQDASLLDAHAEAGHSFIPLRGKRPIEEGWPEMGLAKAKARMASGRNVGVKLRASDLVIDVDPRNTAEGEEDVYDRLRRAFGLPDAPFVRTGGGGWHYYFRTASDVAVLDGLPDYKGVEFKSLGRQVVAAGSVHPDTGRLYSHDDDPLALPLSAAPEITPALLQEITRRSSETSDGVPGEVAPELLADWLALIDVEEFRDERKWRDLMMACHHATNGEGVEEFVAWSTAAAGYGDHDEKIRRRWRSLDNKKGAITVKTLIAALPKDRRREAVEAVGRSPAEEDFADDVEPGPERTALRAVCDQWVWVADASQFVRRTDTKKWRADQWKTVHAGLKPEGDILNAVWKGNVPVRKFESLVYLPEVGEFPDGEAGGRYNIWRRSGVEAAEGDVSVFLDHMAHLFPDEGDRGHVLDYLALLVQRPAEKIHFALLVRGVQGTGKSWIGNLMQAIVGGRNVVRPSNDEVVSRWTSWMEGAQLAVIEELMTLGRKEVANRLKPAITDPMLRIEDKGCSLYSIPNCLNFICFTNHEDALPIEQGDRRWLVVFSPAARREAAYYDGLFGFLDQGGAAFVKHWLMAREVVVNPRGVAPFTVGKEEMRRLSIGDAEAFLLEAYEAAEAPFDHDLVRVDDLVAEVPSALRGRSNLRARVSKFLKEEIGAVTHARYTKGGRKRSAVQLWSVRNHEVWESIGAAGRIDAYQAHRHGARPDREP